MTEEPEIPDLTGASPDSTKRLIPFLRKLADSIEENNIRPRQLQNVGEFFMKYQFEEESSKDEEGTSVPLGDSGDFEMEELVKFLVMGWWVYCMILKDSRFNRSRLAGVEDEADSHSRSQQEDTT